METMLPDMNLDAFYQSVTEAVILADEGQADQGYRVLNQALERAERAREGGEEWGEEMARHYRMALVRFANRYSIPPL
jgi:hypothetical protein